MKSTGAVVAAVSSAPLVTLFEGCAAAANVFYLSVENDKVVVPRNRLPDLASLNNHVKIYANEYANPIILFVHDGGEMRALLSTCSHSGCEVRKLRTKFECPCHGSEYDLHGNVLRGPAPEPLQSFQVRRLNESIEILLG